MKRPVCRQNDGIDFKYMKPHARFRRIKISVNMLSLKIFCPDFVEPYDCILFSFQEHFLWSLD